MWGRHKTIKFPKLEGGKNPIQKFFIETPCIFIYIKTE